jgi:hypothetical protein
MLRNFFLVSAGLQGLDRSRREIGSRTSGESARRMCLTYGEVAANPPGCLHRARLNCPLRSFLYIRKDGKTLNRLPGSSSGGSSAFDERSIGGACDVLIAGGNARTTLILQPNVGPALAVSADFFSSVTHFSNALRIIRSLPLCNFRLFGADAGLRADDGALARNRTETL